MKFYGINEFVTRNEFDLTSEKQIKEHLAARSNPAGLIKIPVTVGTDHLEGERLNFDADGKTKLFGELRLAFW